MLKYLAWVVTSPRVSGDDRQQLFVASLRVVVGLDPFRLLPNVRRHEAQKLPNHFEGFFFRVSQIVDDAGCKHLAAMVAKFLFCNVVTESRLHNRRTSREYLTGVLHHYVEVAQTRFDSGKASYRTHDGGHHRHLIQQFHCKRSPRAVREIGPAQLFECPDAASDGVQESDQGQPPLRSVFQSARLAAVASLSGPAAHREIASIEKHAKPIDFRCADYPWVGEEIDQLIILVGGAAGQR